MPPVQLIALILGGLLLLALLIRRTVGKGFLYRMIFETDTPAGKTFDVVLLIAIVLSVGAVVIESDPVLRLAWGHPFQLLEWGFTLLFTLEYLLRLLCVRSPLLYARSFFGVVDLLSIVPSFLGLLVGGAQVFLVVRMLRVMRVFRVLKLGEYLQESNLLWDAIVAGRRKISVFLLAMITLVTVIGSLMYVIEGPERGFRSIPVGIYWAIVTITTVGYGDVTPQTTLGRFLASVVMLLGYSIIAVPTGIISAEIGQASARQHEESQKTAVMCAACLRTGHDPEARHCKFCGAEL
ncbi:MULTISPECIES: ion transporter [unclassified Cyanobium]|uniref:ion transporter n=1 Tax=unclassified Cyanobium TaxID=2627006 RepID=UPI0020CE20B2|nr:MULTISPECIES: ion transporter [unclassified Cyanobium]MCP9857554.1 ion transporter [Cyanobium sp. Cruz-8H5]MCP9864873.1 ion transporter [Cyanobium sp. Cruz-8D1]